MFDHLDIFQQNHDFFSHDFCSDTNRFRSRVNIVLMPSISSRNINVSHSKMDQSTTAQDYRISMVKKHKLRGDQVVYIRASQGIAGAAMIHCTYPRQDDTLYRNLQMILLTSFLQFGQAKPTIYNAHYGCVSVFYICLFFKPSKQNHSLHLTNCRHHLALLPTHPKVIG